jgi:hypothetical protein
MRREEHLLIGAILFGLYTIPILYFTPITIGYAFWGFIVGALGSVMPDVIEPAYNWQHRSIFHSSGVLQLSIIIFVITGLLGFLTIINGYFYYSYLLSGFFLGYAAHLLADSTTKMGIPQSDLPKIKFPKLPKRKVKELITNPGRKITEEDKLKAVSCKVSGNSLYKKGNYQDALWFYEKGLRLDPNNSDLLYNKNMALAKLKSK